MKGKTGYKILIALFMCVLVLPGALFLVKALSGEPCDVKLKGYFDAGNAPKLTAKNVSNGTFQSDTTNWFNQNFPPRGVLIQSYNSMRYMWFHQGNDILGKDDYIFEYSYVSSELMLEEKNDLSLPENQELMRDYVNKLVAIEDALHAQGKGLVFYISASKADECHDKLPDEYVAMSPENGIRPVDYLRQLFDEAGFDYLYTPDLIEGIPCDAFYASGIHWTRPLEQQVSLAVLRKIQEETGLTYRSWVLTDLQSSSEPYNRDTDVYNSMNIWQPPFDDVFYQYDTENVELEEYDQLNILMQGGSFSHGFWSDVWEHNPDEIIHYINYCEYYYDSHDFIPLNYKDGIPDEKMQAFYDKLKNGNMSFSEMVMQFQELSCKWDNVPIEQYLSEVDCVVIEINESVITNYSNGFVDQLYKYLCEGGQS
ncbi:MAG: hypothetical protein J6Y08_06220 [Clostridiales bacterium]|nr:hypothetical protein [Clostridiales bacterium]